MASFSEIEVADLDDILTGLKVAVQLVDVRTPQERGHGSIPNSDIVPFERVAVSFDRFDRTSLIVLYSQTGCRSAAVCALLENHGFENVVSLRGGFHAWRTSGLRVA